MGEKNKEDNMVDAIGEDEVSGIKNEEIPILKEEVRELANSGRLDAYGYYLLVKFCQLLCITVWHIF